MIKRLTDFDLTRGKWLFIPVEVKVRELQAKTLLACLAAERGFNVVLGEAHAVRGVLHQLPAGIVLEKGVCPSQVESFESFRELGNLVVSWCEEGLVFFNDDDYIRRKIFKKDIEQVEYFFAWGKYHAEVISSRFPVVKELVIPCGNPRFDLIRPEYRDLFKSKADELRSRFGSFILVNTNFNHCNHQKGEGAYLDALKRTGKLKKKDDEIFAAGWMEHKKRLFDTFFPMIARISEFFPDYKVIVRPHQSENHDTWNKAFKDTSNVLVLHEGGVIPWIMASSVVIHNGCTTGIEAALLDHPAIAYRPVISETYDQYLPNSVNYQADSEESLVKSLDLLLIHEKKEDFINNPEWGRTLKQYISSLDEISSCDTILNHVEKIEKNIKPANRRIWYLLHRINLRAYLKTYALLNKLIVGGRNRGDYSLQKFDHLELSELTKEVTKLSQVSGRFSSIAISNLTKNIFKISK